MTPQLQQAIKLLALSNLELETFVGEAIEANPLLEWGDGGSPEAVEPSSDDPRRTQLESSPVDQLIGEGRAADDAPLDIDRAALDHDRDTGDGSTTGELDCGARTDAGSTRSEGTGTSIDERVGAAATLAEHLHAQVGAVSPDPRLTAIARWLIDQLDDAGYLALPLSEAAAELGVPLGQAKAGLRLIQSLDPTGVGARTLSECLALQAIEADRYDPCMARLMDNLELVAKGAFPQLKRLCRVDDEDFADMLGELRGYDPKPGLRFGGGAADTVTPDILVRASVAGGWDIALNPATLPRLVVNRSYYTQLRGSCDDPSGRGWLSEKLAHANWLVKALDQRQRTILKVAAEIVRRQDRFFRRGVAELKPLTLRAVAESVALHESTVSRVTSNKYLHCERGTFELKYFFSSGVGLAEGEGTVSAETVKAQIRALIDAEDPRAVLSDDTLTELLRARGFDLARRTVAKYREAIGLGSSVQRRREKAFVAAR
jgi:RNA polymerase sigma-54 factor